MIARFHFRNNKRTW